MENILWIIFYCALYIVLIFTLISSIRLGIKGFYNFSENKLSRFITSEYWCVSMFLFIPMEIGEFARGETSPLPWEAFRQEYLQYGLNDGLLTIGIVILVDLWLLWIPANIWINRNSDIDKRHRIMARLTNLLGGLLLLTVDNPVHKLIESI